MRDDRGNLAIFRLEGDSILLDTQRLYIDNLGAVLAVLQAIIVQDPMVGSA